MTTFNLSSKPDTLVDKRSKLLKTIKTQHSTKPMGTDIP